MSSVSSPATNNEDIADHRKPLARLKGEGDAIEGPRFKAGAKQTSSTGNSESLARSDVAASAGSFESEGIEALYTEDLRPMLYNLSEAIEMFKGVLPTGADLSRTFADWNEEAHDEQW